MRLAAVLFLVAAPTAAAPAQVPGLPACLHRWDFETGTQGWTKWSDGEMVQECRQGGAHLGRSALWGSVTGRHALVHSVDGLSVPMSAVLRLWLYAPEGRAPDRITLSLRTYEHGPQSSPMFQAAFGVRPGRWQLIEVPFSELFGWSDRVFDSWTIRQFEVSADGPVEVALDDVEILAPPGRQPPRPSVMWLPGQDVTQAPAGARAQFSHTFELDHMPRYAWLQAGGDDQGTAFVNGVELGTASLTGPGEYDLVPHLRVGRNMVCLAVANHGEAPNPSGGLAVIGWGDARPDEHVVVSGTSWRSSAGAPNGWTGADFDNSAWPAADAAYRAPGGPWGVPDVYPLRQPVDRATPEVTIYAGGDGLWTMLRPLTPLLAPLRFSVGVSALDADSVAGLGQMTDGELVPGADPLRVQLAVPEGTSGPVAATVSFGPDGAQVTKVAWLPGAPAPAADEPAQCAEATGVFRAERVGDRWWLIDAHGRPFWSLACNAVMHEPYWSFHYSRLVANRYVDERSWQEVTVDRLCQWGFNSSSGSPADEPWARRGRPYFAGWNLTWAGPRLQDADGRPILFPDVFDPDWQRGAEGRVRETTERYKDDPLLIGYWTDNEIQMHDPMSPSLGIMGSFWSPGCRKELSRWLSERYGGDIEALNRRWSSREHTYAYGSFEDLPADKPQIRGAGDPVAPDLRDFVRHIIGTYAETYVRLWKKHDPRHLVCSNRFAGQFNLDFADLLKPFDIIACNSYPRDHWGQTEFDRGQLQWLRRMHQITGRPVLISEWGTQARDSRLCNNRGRLDTQAQRGECYERVMHQLWDEDYIVGAHWFCWADSTDGERANWGLVDAFDRPYLELTSSARRANLWLTDQVRQWEP
ncbi:MAG TPA: beta-galactosidase [Armatimonadota bacterium]|nr:beta-galactosidase [Armatimonadota bacterium]